MVRARAAAILDGHAPRPRRRGTSVLLWRHR